MAYRPGTYAACGPRPVRDPNRLSESAAKFRLLPIRTSTSRAVQTSVCIYGASGSNCVFSVKIL